MKREKTFYQLLIMLLFVVCPNKTYGQEAETAKLLMPQFGKEVVAVEGEILFYDPWGEGDIASSSSSNSLSAVVFKPVEKGKSVQITFETLELLDDGASWPAHIKIYNGAVDADGTFTYPEATYEVTSSSELPEGEEIAKLTGTYTGKTYYSTSPDGALSVGFLYRYAKKCAGWKATVSCVTLENMQITEAGSTYGAVSVSPATREAVALATLYVDTEGVTAPDILKTITFTLPVNENAVTLSGLKLYPGEQTTFKGVEPLEADITEADGVYTITTTQTLKPGSNKFTIAANIDAEVPFGSRVKLEINGIATSARPQGIPNFSKAEAPIITLPYTILMPESGEYIVGDKAIQFFDDGGIDGKISEGFSGQVTFRPADKGKKVMINFTKVSLFESSNKNEILKIYNGAEAKESELIQQIKNGATGVIRSTSSDGALTVTLDCDTGYPKDGFEAVVSQFEPQAMTVETISVSQITEGTVCSGDTMQQILCINIKTQNTEPALSIDKFIFETCGTQAAIQAAALYSTGKNNKFSAQKKIGEAQITSDKFEIKTAAAGNLTEGDNYFWLTYDIAASVDNGEKIDALLSGVVLSGALHEVPDGNPEGDRTIENIVYSILGTTSKNVKGTWKFKSQPNPLSYYDGYDPTEGNRITTFLPATEGKIIELDITDFHVYYSATDYGVKSVFKIFSGQDTSGELLWTLDSPDKASTGPAKVLRSTSHDGAITVLFNTSTNLSYYTDKGWTAEVREYKSQNMYYVGSEVKQASDEYVSGGQTRKEILQIKVVTLGDKNPITANSMEIDLKGGETSISAISLYYGGTNPDYQSARLVDNIDDITPSAAHAITITHNEQLAEGDNYYWVTYDISPDAVPGTNLDARLLAVTIDGDKKAIENGDPEGSREVKNTINMPVSGETSINVGQYPYMFYDDGGADGDYTSAQSGTITFIPRSGERIKLEFKQFMTSTYDYLQIYRGKEATPESLVRKFDGNLNASLPETLLSDAEDGAMTIKFNRTGYAVNKGWEIEVTSYEPVPLSYGNITSIAPEKHRTLFGGASDEAVLRIAIETSGDTGEFTIDKFIFEAVGSNNLATMKLYYTGTSDKFDTKNLYGEVHDTTETTITGAGKISESGTVYFWLAVGIKNNAISGETTNITFTGIDIDGKACDIDQSETVAITIKDGLSGTYTIGEGGDYTTITSAVEAIKGGISGAVEFNILSGTYHEELLIPEIPGASENNTITFRSATGDYSDVTITSDNFQGSGYNDENSAVMTIYGADYLTISGITFTNPDNTYTYLADVKNSSRHVTFENCQFKAAIMTSEPLQSDARKLLHTNFVNQAVPNTPDEYLTVRSSLFEGGYIAIQAGGANISDMNIGTRITDCIFKDQWSKAIYLNYDIEGEISGNTIESKSATSKEYVAIDLSNVQSTVITSNKIITEVPYISAIKMRPATGTPDKPLRIYNNILNIAGLEDGSSAYAISITGGSSTNTVKNIDIVYNTVRMQGSNTAASAAIYNISNFTSSIQVKNNILQNEADGYVYWINSKPLRATTLGNNVLYTTGPTFSKNYATYENWETASKESGSSVSQAEYDSDKYLTPADIAELKIAVPISYVTTDIEGTVRDNEHPVAGAYETAHHPAGTNIISIPETRQVYYTQGALVFKNCSGYNFKIYTTDGRYSGSYTITDDNSTITARHAQGIYIVAGTKGKETYTATIYVK